MSINTTYKKSKSGFYTVELSSAHEHAGHVYKPGASRITVNEEILEDMIAAKKVTRVTSA
jgi:hypothetical protein